MNFDVITENIAHVTESVARFATMVWWPWTIFFMIGAALSITVALRFVQFRYFLRAWRQLFAKSDHVSDAKADMTPLQAFINTLGSNTGNGSIAGVSVAIYAGGPGAAFWIFTIGFLSMALRYAEVYLGAYFIGQHPNDGSIGGPMAYLRLVPGGAVLPYLFALLCFLYGVTSGNMMQCNSIGIGMAQVCHVPEYIVGVVLALFMVYIMIGGSKRINAISDKLVPFKIGFFLTALVLVLGYHFFGIMAALRLIMQSAFNPMAVAGGTLGYTIQSAMQAGISRALNANEAGLGTAAIFAGGSGSKDPARDGIVSMVGPFIATQMICFMVALSVVVSGVWNSGLTSTALTIAAFETVFGVLGGPIVTFCVVSFGLSVLISFTYIAKKCWLFLTGNRYAGAFTVLYACASFFGTIAKVDLVWHMNDIVNAGMIFINLFGVLWLLPLIVKGLRAYAART